MRNGVDFGCQRVKGQGNMEVVIPSWQLEMKDLSHCGLKLVPSAKSE